MITLIEFILGTLALFAIMLPFIHLALKGTYEFRINKGLVFGANYDNTYFQAKHKGEDEEEYWMVYRLHMVAFHFGIVTASLAFSLAHPEIEPEEKP